MPAAGVSVEGELLLAGLVLGGGNEGRLVCRSTRGQTEEAWLTFLHRLKQQDGAAEPILVCCHGHPAALKAIRAAYPDALIQISVTHRLRALGERLDPRWRGRCLAEARRIFSALDRPSAIVRFRAWRDRWLAQGELRVRTLERDLALCLTFYRFSPPARRDIRTLRLLRQALRNARKLEQASPPHQGDAPPSSPDGDGFIVHVDEQARDLTLREWLQTARRDRKGLAQIGTGVTSAIGLAARLLLGRGN